jgi:hypothetical protein
MTTAFFYVFLFAWFLLTWASLNQIGRRLTEIEDQHVRLYKILHDVFDVLSRKD